MLSATKLLTLAPRPRCPFSSLRLNDTSVISEYFLQIEAKTTRPSGTNLLPLQIPPSFRQQYNIEPHINIQLLVLPIKPYISKSSHRLTQILYL
jgi:hypothetical protein